LLTRGNQDYVVEKWDDVSISEEFEQCCQEVAAGEYVILFMEINRV
jgi:hypothetical protein